MEDIQSRIVALIDMDCFYVQVEQKLAPEWKGKPCAVVQYNEWKGGGIIAVGYEARAKGVLRRNMRGDDAKKVCPDIKLFQVPELRGKADLTRYREAGAQVISVLAQFAACVERASVDEAYIDLTLEVDRLVKENCPISSSDLPNTHVVGAEPIDDRPKGLSDWLNEAIGETDNVDPGADLRLAYGALIVEKMRKAVREQTGFNCSGGISHNKVLSKLACGINKPNKQTILSMPNLGDLFNSMEIKKVRHFGGKLGESLKDKFHCQTMGDVSQVLLADLVREYGDKTGKFVHDLSRGVDTEPVKNRHLPQSVGCSKNFRGKLAITTYEKVHHWMRRLAAELEERLIKDREEHSRISRNLNISIRFSDYQSVSRACTLSRYTHQAIETSVMTALRKVVGSTEPFNPSINSLGISCGKFSDISSQSLETFIKPSGSGSANADSVQDPFSSLTPSAPRSGSDKNLPSSSINKFVKSNKIVDPFLHVDSEKSENQTIKRKQVSSSSCLDSFVNSAASDFDPFEAITEKRLRDGHSLPAFGRLRSPRNLFFRTPLIHEGNTTPIDIIDEDILSSELLPLDNG